MSISRGIHEQGERLYDPNRLYASSNWDTSKELLWAVAAGDAAPLWPGDYTEAGGAQVALSRVIRTPLPPESAMWWTITAYGTQVARVGDSQAVPEYFPLSDGDVANGLPGLRPLSMPGSS